MIFWKWKKDEEYFKSYKNTNVNTNTNTNVNTNTNTNVNSNTNTNTNKREEIDSKLSNRSMIAQVGLNPFLTNSSFSDNLSTYDKIGRAHV